ncbi:hypothetical protein Y032_0062g3341 [Ancylostoma ceylanicum]|uniref:Uncharacterized protein n=1 Tax=Ancylostoma ceylanicum TaxID=53326 RepID=A0A016U3C6_9BILA|nr:hypothetical protein Y032_0062g3341 [Ancylostoma ceylanicum]
MWSDSSAERKKSLKHLLSPGRNVFTVPLTPPFCPTPWIISSWHNLLHTIHESHYNFSDDHWFVRDKDTRVFVLRTKDKNHVIPVLLDSKVGNNQPYTMAIT